MCLRLRAIVLAHLIGSIVPKSSVCSSFVSGVELVGIQVLRQCRYLEIYYAFNEVQFVKFLPI